MSAHSNACEAVPAALAAAAVAGRSWGTRRRAVSDALACCGGRRKKLGYDGGLRTTGGFANKVMVYSTKAVNPHQSPSMLEKSVGPGERWIDNRFGSNFVVRVSVGADGAEVVLRGPIPAGNSH